MINYVYQFELSGFLITVAVLLSFLHRKNISTRSISSFFILLLLNLGCTFFNLLSIYFLSHNEFIPSWGLFFLNLFYFVFLNTIPITFQYNMFFTSSDNKMPDKKITLLINMPYWIELFLVLTTFATGWIFSITPEKTYIRGPLMPLLYVIGTGYMISALVLFIRKRKNYNTMQSVTIITFVFLNFFALISQLFFAKYILSGFSFSISIFISYISLEDPENYINTESGALNREAFISDVKKRLDHKYPFKIMAINIPELKYLNKTIGYKNRVEITNVICQFFYTLFNSKNVYHFSLNRFVIIFPSEDTLTQFSQIEAIRNRFNEIFTTSSIEVSLSAIMTVINYPDEANNIDDILDLIDNSFEDLTATERNSLSHANVKLLEKRRRNVFILHQLEEALKNDGFEIIYQPIFSIKDNSFTSIETILILKDTSSESGYITSQEFIPVAEKNGMILKISQYILKESCKFMYETKLYEYGIKQLKINLSVGQFFKDDFYKQILSTMDTYNLDYNCLNLEVSDYSVSTADETLINNMKILKENNVSFTLDSFGTGYSNTSTLVKFPFTAVKLHKDMVREAMREEKTKIVLQQTIEMIKDLNMDVIMEGITSVYHVRGMSYDYIQGPYYSKPLSKDDIVTFIKRNNSIVAFDLPE